MKGSLAAAILAMVDLSAVPACAEEPDTGLLTVFKAADGEN